MSSTVVLLGVCRSCHCRWLSVPWRLSQPTPYLVAWTTRVYSLGLLKVGSPKWAFVGLKPRHGQGCLPPRSSERSGSFPGGTQLRARVETGSYCGTSRSFLSPCRPQICPLLPTSLERERPALHSPPSAAATLLGSWPHLTPASASLSHSPLRLCPSPHPLPLTRKQGHW